MMSKTDKANVAKIITDQIKATIDLVDETTAELYEAIVIRYKDESAKSHANELDEERMTNRFLSYLRNELACEIAATSEVLETTSILKSLSLYRTWIAIIDLALS